MNDENIIENYIELIESFPQYVKAELKYLNIDIDNTETTKDKSKLENIIAKAEEIMVKDYNNENGYISTIKHDIKHREKQLIKIANIVNKQNKNTEALYNNAIKNINQLEFYTDKLNIYAKYKSDSDIIWGFQITHEDLQKPEFIKQFTDSYNETLERYKYADELFEQQLKNSGYKSNVEFRRMAKIIELDCKEKKTSDTKLNEIKLIKKLRKDRNRMDKEIHKYIFNINQDEDKFINGYIDISNMSEVLLENMKSIQDFFDCILDNMSQVTIEEIIKQKIDWHKITIGEYLGIQKRINEECNSFDF